MTPLMSRTFFPMAAALLWPRPLDACTIIAVGKKATVDGSVMVTQSHDAQLSSDKRLVYVPARNHTKGAMRPIYNTWDEGFPRYAGSHFGPDYYPLPGYHVPSGNAIFDNTDDILHNAFKDTLNTSQAIGYIPQIEHTFGYQDGSFGIINEHSLAIGESSASAHIHPTSRGKALLNAASLSKIALERCTTARQAIELMGNLAFEYGYYGEDFGEPGEILGVADKEEAWVFNILPDPTGTSAIWAAKRVPDEEVAVCPNVFCIFEVDANDSANYIYSPNLFTVALERGWWHPSEKLDFQAVYGKSDNLNHGYAGYRIWRVFDMIRPSVKLPLVYRNLRVDEPYPFSVKPDKLLSVRDLHRIHRDYYVGSELDMTKGIRAGPFGSPDQPMNPPARSLSIFRASYVQVCQVGGRNLTKNFGVVWFAAGCAHHSAFVPVPTLMKKSIAPLWKYMLNYSNESMYWAASAVMLASQSNFQSIHPVVEEKQRQVEDKAEELLHRAAQLDQHEDEVSSMFESHADDVLAVWIALVPEVLWRFSDWSDVQKRISSTDFSDSWYNIINNYEACLDSSGAWNCSSPSTPSTPWFVVSVSVLAGALGGVLIYASLVGRRKVVADDDGAMHKAMLSDVVGN